LLEKRSKLSRYATGSEKFDNLLNGGFETQAITELVGEFAAGKSQICHTLCVAASELIENDSGNIIFIDSENTFRADRIHQIAEQRGFDPLPILERIFHCKVYSSEHLESVINGLDKSIEQYNAKLVIIDSIISLHRAEFSGRGTLAERQQRLGKMLNRLRRYADVYNIAVIITNQVVSNPDGTEFGFDSMKATGGNIVAHNTTYRIFLRKSGKNRVATMFDSPSHPYQHVKFSISESGIQDAISYKTDGSDSGW
jgi:DNA repair protein RadA